MVSMDNQRQETYKQSSGLHSLDLLAAQEVTHRKLILASGQSCTGLHVCLVPFISALGHLFQINAVVSAAILFVNVTHVF